MQPNESIKNLYNRLLDITNMTAIKESKDLKTMEIEELLGSLMTHEVKLNKRSTNLVEKKLFKNKALKAWHLSDDESSDDEVIEQVANLCFMALSDDDENDNEVDDSYTFGKL
ncbi:hypothetical protein CFOL_v3_03865 [Cephalotus follicularis]|uniref:UBN2 domain-containing protein n=1 Tax=Cephalotus follicularis TaxID=3775 RepID=A0A1Q3AXF2_CEPFO|nr:hypothetical protein CFOL_v3_03865 [Cephalotus follicularis]